MAKMKAITESHKRESEILLAVLRLIKDNDGEMRYADIKEELPKVFQFTEEERGRNNTWDEKWHPVLGMIGGIELKTAGIVDIKKSVWSLTQKGEQALNLTPEEFYVLYHYSYKQIQKAKKAISATSSTHEEDSDEPASDESTVLDINSIEDKAREGIRQYIRSKGAYEFQNMIAALLRGMGYFTPYIADKGKDGGVDVVAYEDTLGASGAHIKVQVKHMPDASISVDIVRALISKLTKVNDIGIVATSGRFTNESKKEARDHQKHIRLLDMEDIIDLWLQFYPRMSAEDKDELPITPIYHLNTDRL